MAGGPNVEQEISFSCTRCGQQGVCVYAPGVFVRCDGCGGLTKLAPRTLVRNALTE